MKPLADSTYTYFSQHGVFKAIHDKLVTNPQIACEAIGEYYMRKQAEPMSLHTDHPTYADQLVNSINWGHFTKQPSVYALFAEYVAQMLVNDDFIIDPQALDTFCTHFDEMFPDFNYSELVMMWTTYGGNSMRDMIKSLMEFYHFQCGELSDEVQQIYIDAHVCTAESFAE